MKVLISQQEIARRVEELGREIEATYRGKRLTVVSVLKGSFVFAADLVRSMSLDVRVDFLGCRSYGAHTETSGVVQITHDLGHSIEGEHVLIVEDIIDTGLTMHYLLDNLRTRRPAGLQVATLLHKPARAKVEVAMHYVGFVIEDAFVVGYGLDADERYRNLPHIAVLDDADRSNASPLV